MDRAKDEYGHLRSQVDELRSVNDELGRALAAAASGTPLRSSIAATLALSRVEDAELRATAAQNERDAAIAERSAAIAERDQAVGALQKLNRLHAEQVTDLMRLSDELTAQRNATTAAVTERDDALAAMRSMSADLELARSMLSRRSVRTAQRAARAASPIFSSVRRLRGGTGNQ